jgi:uncharacterized membrane protein
MQMTRPRLDSIDLLRGLVMVLMALDHTRDFFHNSAFNPLDLARTNEALFLTRWVTHFCAPVFMFLAGTGAYLSLTRGKTKVQLAWFLCTRGLWLVVLELTVVHFGWYFNFDYRYSLAQVIWALGWCMVILAPLVFLPTRLVGLIGIVIIAGHNLFDNVRPFAWGDLSWLWMVLHVPGTLSPLPDMQLYLLYPLVPWIGVMAAGYAFGELFTWDEQRRRKWLLSIGSGLTQLFIVLRYTNWYGDPRPWMPQKDFVFTLFSFINCEKYPPSLLFLLMTLGPAIVALPWFERIAITRIGQPFVSFGRVPLFYYLIHLQLIHAAAFVAAYLRFGRADWLVAIPALQRPPRDNGYDLWVVYLVWLGIVLTLYPICHWLAHVKQRYRAAWLSYL